MALLLLASVALTVGTAHAAPSLSMSAAKAGIVHAERVYFGKDYRGRIEVADCRRLGPRTVDCLVRAPDMRLQTQGGPTGATWRDQARQHRDGVIKVHTVRHSAIFG